MQLQEVWAIGKKDAAATRIPANDKYIQKPAPTITMESLNHVATILWQFAKLSRTCMQITPQLRQIVPPLLRRNTSQLRNKSLLD